LCAPASAALPAHRWRHSSHAWSPARMRRWREGGWRQRRQGGSGTDVVVGGGRGGGYDVLSPAAINGCVALQREVLCFATSPSAQAAMVEKVGGGRRGGGDKGERNKVSRSSGVGEAGGLLIQLFNFSVAYTSVRSFVLSVSAHTHRCCVKNINVPDTKNE